MFISWNKDDKLNLLFGKSRLNRTNNLIYLFKNKTK